MVLDLKALNSNFNLNIKGIIHIGAHIGQELNIYQEMNINNVIFFEPIKKTFEQLKNNVGDKAILFNTALGNMIGEVEMHTETFNQGMSNSILEPGKHLTQYPNITFNNKEKVSITKLDEYLSFKDDYNFIMIDVQGYELEVFKGGSEFLNNIDYVMTEVNRDEVYKGCAKINELDDFLSNYGFDRVETDWIGDTWGDAFYIKR